MVTGKQAFSGNTSAEIFDAILKRMPVAPVRLNPEIPAELEHIINKALEKSPDLRYQHAADLRSDLQRLKRDTESGGAPPRQHKSSRKPVAKSTQYRWVAVTSATIMLLGVAVGGWLFFSHKAHARSNVDTIVLGGRQQDGRYGVRRYAEAGTLGAITAVAVSLPYFRGRSKSNP
jgi:serine/threonine protein kinase